MPFLALTSCKLGVPNNGPFTVQPSSQPKWLDITAMQRLHIAPTNNPHFWQCHAVHRLVPMSTPYALNLSLAGAHRPRPLPERRKLAAQPAASPRAGALHLASWPSWPRAPAPSSWPPQLQAGSANILSQR